MRNEPKKKTAAGCGMTHHEVCPVLALFETFFRNQAPKKKTAGAPRVRVIGGDNV